MKYIWNNFLVGCLVALNWIGIIFVYGQSPASPPDETDTLTIGCDDILTLFINEVKQNVDEANNWRIFKSVKVSRVMVHNVSVQCQNKGTGKARGIYVNSTFGLTTNTCQWTCSNTLCESATNYTMPRQLQPHPQDPMGHPTGQDWTNIIGTNAIVIWHKTDSSYACCQWTVTGDNYGVSGCDQVTTNLAVSAEVTTTPTVPDEVTTTSAEQYMTSPYAEQTTFFEGNATSSGLTSVEIAAAAAASSGGGTTIVIIVVFWWRRKKKKKDHEDPDELGEDNKDFDYYRRGTVYEDPPEPDMDGKDLYELPPDPDIGNVYEDAIDANVKDDVTKVPEAGARNNGNVYSGPIDPDSGETQKDLQNGAAVAGVDPCARSTMYDETPDTDEPKALDEYAYMRNSSITTPPGVTQSPEPQPSPVDTGTDSPLVIPPLLPPRDNPPIMEANDQAALESQPIEAVHA